MTAVALIVSTAAIFFDSNAVHPKELVSAEQRVLSVQLDIVTYMIDGDTLYVRPVEGGKTVSVRIDGIDAPEICQIGRQQAREIR